MMTFDHWKFVPSESWRWPNFTPQEWACRGDNKILIIPEFMDRLQSLRNQYGGPLKVTSGYRSPSYNMQVSNSGADGPHTTGRAVDIAVSGPLAFKIVKLALGLGFTGIGLKQKGPHTNRFIHLDDLKGSMARPRPTIWTY